MPAGFMATPHAALMSIASTPTQPVAPPATHRSGALALLDRIAGRWRHRRRPTYHVARWAFLRALGLIYLAAFLSFWVQMPGLIGSRGIVPAERLMAAAAEQLGPGHLRALPTLCWVSASDGFLHTLCASGVLFSALLVAGVCPPLLLAMLYALYLSLVLVSRQFLAYQWDALLLEAGFLAIFYAPFHAWWRTSRERPPSAVVHALLVWLLFRLMWSAGLVKLGSGDTAWWPDLTALTFHYQTQPLPPWTAWYLHAWPVSLHRLCCAMTLILELAFPLLIVGPRSARLLAFMGLVLLQGVILLTGNFTFFNWLAIALCLLLLEDSLFPARWRNRVFPSVHVAPAARWKQRLERAVQAGLAAGILILSVPVLWAQGEKVLARWTGAQPTAWPLLLHRLHRAAAPFHVVNSYGLFAMMTKTRPEILIQGSRDGETWLDYEFPHKPGSVVRRPGFVAPHQPRLDWQMWFAALGDMNSPATQSWFLPFMVRLLEGSPPVLSLMESNPFPDKPPLYVRALVTEYRFTTPAERKARGAWWKAAEPPRVFCPPISFQNLRER